MNINNNLKYNNSDMQRLFTNSLSNKFMYNQLDCYFDSQTKKWMVRNNLGVYEVWGVMPTVDDLEDVTTYTGKLVLYDGHEYKWNGDEWIDLGEGIDQIISLKGLTTSSYWITNYIPNNDSKIEIKWNKEQNITYYTSPLGSGTSGTSTDKVQISINRDHNELFGYFGTANGQSNPPIFVPNTLYIISLQKNKVVINDVEYNIQSQTFSATYPLWIGATNFAGILDANALQGKIYYLKIWENGTLVRNYEPQPDLTFKDSITGHVAALVGSAEAESVHSIPEEYPSQPQMSFYKLADSFSVINDYFNWDIDQTNEIVSNISEATKTYAYNTSDNTWYVKNDDGNYEEWGVMPTVDSLDDLTTYTGKLVILSTDSHEYKWTGEEWTDLGEGVNALVAITTNAVDKKGSVPEYKITKDGTDFILTGTQHDVECLVSFEKELRNGGDIHNDAVIFNSETRSDSQEIEGFYALGNLYFDFAQGSRVFFSGSSIVPNNKYTLSYTNGHFLGTLLCQAGRQAIFLDNDAKSTSGKSSINNTNPNIKISSKYIDVYEIKIYDDNGLIYDLKPIDLNGTITLHDSINGINATLVSGEPIGIYEEDIPERYPDKPAPTLRLTKPSYNNALTGSYINGQKVTVYKNTYKIYNKFTTIPASIYFENIHGSWEACEDSEHTKEGYNVMQSKDSYHVSNAYDLVKFTFAGIDNLSIIFGSYAESNYDYVMIGKLDTDCSNWTNGTSYTDSRVADYSYGRQSSNAPDRTYTFTNDNGEHYFYVMYRKDGSGDTGSDRGYIGFDESIPINLPISANKLLAFTALTDNTTVSLITHGENHPDIQYSFNKLNWFHWDYSAINLINGQTVYMKGFNPDGFQTGNMNFSKFSGTGQYKVSGPLFAIMNDAYRKAPEDIMIGDWGMCYMFYGDTCLIDASELIMPGDDELGSNVASHIMDGMFNGCSNLISAPAELPYENLASKKYCYDNMFAYCTSLTKSPILPGTWLSEGCYSYMFNGCTHLNEITCNATILANNATENWHWNVSATGTFYKNANMEDWTIGDNGIPSGWTVEDIADRYIEFDENPSDYKIYGWILRTDFDDVTQSQRGTDVNFGNYIGTTYNNPRMSAQYNNGVYTDNSFTDKRIQDNLPTLNYVGYSWYYYYFENTNGCYHQGYGGGQSRIDYYKTYMKFIIKPQQ